jgi:DNA modification methylase
MATPKPIKWKNVKKRLGDLKPWIRNPRRIDAAHGARLDQSLDEFGQVDIFAIGPKNEVYNGHQRLGRLLQSKGEKHWVDCRQASRALSEKERRKLTALLHAGAQGQWDWDMLKDWDREELKNFGMDRVTLKDWRDDVHALGSILDDEEVPEIEDPGVDLSLADKYQAKWKVRKGDVWELDAHRLVCGDCLDPIVIKSLMAGGDLAHIVWEDPPWNVDYGGTDNPKWKTRKIENDNLGDKFPAFCAGFMKSTADACLPGAILYLKMSAQEWPVIDLAIRDAGFHWSSTIVWVKDRMILSRKDYHTQYEPLWYGWQGDAPRLKRLYDRKQSDTWDAGPDPRSAVPTPPSNSLRLIVKTARNAARIVWRSFKRSARSSDQSDVWRFARPSNSEEHPTMTPVPLIARCLVNSSRPGNIVLDLFLGSGSTLIAAEGTGRILRGAEQDPKYIACSLERWQKMTGRMPKRISRI